MSVKYKVIERETCMDAAALQTEGKSGYDLISHSAVPNALTGITEYCYVFGYKGGLGANNAVNRGR